MLAQASCLQVKCCYEKNYKIIYKKSFSVLDLSFYMFSLNYVLYLQLIMLYAYTSLCMLVGAAFK